MRACISADEVRRVRRIFCFSDLSAKIAFLKAKKLCLEIAIHGSNRVDKAGASNERPLEPKTIHSRNGDGSFAHAHNYRGSVHGIALLQSLVKAGLIPLW